jgi:hypothetical protein
MFEGLKVNENWRMRYKKRNNAVLFGDLHILPFARLSVELDWPCQ